MYVCVLMFFICQVEGLPLQNYFFYLFKMEFKFWLSLFLTKGLSSPYPKYFFPYNV